MINFAMNLRSYPLTLPAGYRCLLHQGGIIEGQQLRSLLQELNTANGRLQLFGAPLAEQPVGCLLTQHIVVALVGAQGIVIGAHLTQFGRCQIAMSSAGFARLLDGIPSCPRDQRFRRGDQRMDLGSILGLKKTLH